MFKFILFVLVAGSLASAKNICFPGDEAQAIKLAGGSQGLRHIDYTFDIMSLIEQNIKPSEKGIGAKSFASIYDGSNTSYKTVCVRLSGQAYMENTCQICIVRY